MKKILNYIHNDLYFEIICFFLLIVSFCVAPITEVFEGFFKILTSPTHLLTDFVFIGGIGGALLNVAIVMSYNIFIIRALKIKMSGPVYSALYIIAGFSFFGKTVINLVPIYTGVWLFARFKKVPLKTLIISLLLSSGISPLVSLIMFGVGLPLYVGIPLAIVCGVLAGFIIPAFSAHTIIFHEGYNLYNSGFAIGVISIVFYAVLSACGLSIKPLAFYDTNTSLVLLVILLTLSVSSIIAALIGEKGVIKKWISLHKSSGRLMTDFIREFSVETVLFNFGILGLFFTGLCLIFKVPINGMIFGTILSNMGLAAFGLHLLNGLPVWIGCALAIIMKKLIGGNFEMVYPDDISTVMAFIFASCLAPVSGKYGPIYGIIAGFIHICVIPYAILLTGGINLYNNGFAAGFEASILAVCGEQIFNKERKGHYAKKQ